MFIFHYYEFSCISATSKGPQWLTLMLADVRIFAVYRRSEEWIHINIYEWQKRRAKRLIETKVSSRLLEFGAIQFCSCADADKSIGLVLLSLCINACDNVFLFMIMFISIAVYKTYVRI